jgi:NADH-quinone oxidoreductase subunit J
MAIIGGLLLGAVLVIGLSQMTLGAVVGLDTANAPGNLPALADIMFGQYVFAFEVTSALLITAAVGAMVLAYIERRKSERTTQVDQMKARFAPGNYPGPKPGPGVFATSSSVATPSRLPDGTISDVSVPQIMAPRELTQAEREPKGTEK